jgi:hypothetical protein
VRLRSLVVSLLGATVLSVFVPSAARADSVADAKDLFSRGRDLRAKGDCASAIPLFRKAYELYPAGLGSLRNTAECEEAVGHFASSRRAWLDLKRALITVEDRKYDGWPHDADEAAARLAPKLATLTLDVSAVAAGGASASSDGIEVRLNGEVLAPGLLGTQLERDPGRYVVRVEGPRVSTPAERVVQLGAGETQRVALRVVVLAPGEAASAPGPTPAPGSAPAPESTPAPAPAETDDVHTDSMRRTGAWVAFGVGAAGVVGTIVSVVVRQSALGGLTSDACTNDNGWMCPASNKQAVQSDTSKGNTASTLVNVFLPVALVGAATGVVLLATSHPRGAGAALVLSPTGAWAMGRF